MEWTDSNFPAEQSSLCCTASFPGAVRWKRPKELDPNACLRGCRISLPVQGSLGDCWLICAFYTLTRSEEAWKRVFDLTNYDPHIGMINVNLWINGSWETVVIDDRLPVVNDDGIQKLFYSYNADRRQFWASLLEKACAKVYGSYELLASGQPSEGYLLVTGGYTWTENIERPILGSLKSKVEYFLTFGDNKNRNYVFLNSVVVEDIASERRKRPQHCYCIVPSESQNKSDESSFCLWDPNTNKLLKSGWSLQMLCESSSKVTYATTDLGTVWDNTNARWSEKIIDGGWMVLSSSGGCRGSSSYCCNPQYAITLKSSNGHAILHLTLIQPSKRYCLGRKELLQGVGMHLFRMVSKPSAPLTSEQLKSLPCVGILNPEYQYSQDVALVVFLSSVLGDSSNFLLIPSTFAKNVTSKYVLRVSSNIPFGINPL